MTLLSCDLGRWTRLFVCERGSLRLTRSTRTSGLSFFTDNFCSIDLLFRSQNHEFWSEIRKSLLLLFFFVIFFIIRRFSISLFF